MNPVQITQTLKQTLTDYLLTTFDANKDGKNPELMRKMRESFEAPNALFNGPYLELIYPYKSSLSLNELCKEGVLSEKLLSLPCFNLPNPEPIPPDIPLYEHQVKAIRKISKEQRSIVISSGTGSGKTECFSIPIINDLIIDPTPGVRALLVYPLNALVNDQMERLRILLKDTDITFGRFTSELPNKRNRNEYDLPNEIISRSEIRDENRFPQILITNYAMLEYLLLRPEDSNLFTSGRWKFLVLDEAHTYTGAQGIEVAMLIRRLKQRLNKKTGEMISIATSATLINKDVNPAIQFAQNLFNESFTSDDIIFGIEDKQHYQTCLTSDFKPPQEAYYDSELYHIIEKIRNTSSQDKNEKSKKIEEIALELHELKLIQDEGLVQSEQNTDIPNFLFEVFSGNDRLLKLREYMIREKRPVDFYKTADEIFPAIPQPELRTKALYNLIELGASAKPAPNRLSLIPAKYHLFVRAPQGMWACLNPDCSGKNSSSDEKWSRLYSNPHEFCESCGAKVYPIYICRGCGQIFIASFFDKNSSRYIPATETLPEEFEKRYFTWNEIEENKELADETNGENDNTEENEPDSGTETSPFRTTEETIICLKCGKNESFCTCETTHKSIPLHIIEKMSKRGTKRKEQIKFSPLTDLNECPRCRSKSRERTEIATPISIRGIGPLANLTYDLYRQLPEANDAERKNKPGGGRKLLTFYDSRQGAARFAAFLQDVANKQNYRHIVPLAIKELLKGNDWGTETPNIISLSKKCGEIILNNDVFQNDAGTEYWRSPNKDSSAREQATLKMCRIILGEFTTGRRSRQSLESMGLVRVTYFPKDRVPDLKGIEKNTKIPESEIKNLISYLLDDLRFSKVITLPSYIHHDDEEFGTNKAHPIVIHGDPKKNEIRWIGKTERHYRRRYVKSVLETLRLDPSDENVRSVLLNIWDWLTKNEKILIGNPSQGYRIDHNQVYFEITDSWFQCKKCQRLSCRGNKLPCPHPKCQGKMEAVEISKIQSHNYYYNLFRETLIPIRVEEHTAQLDSEKGKDYQDKFKNGDINLLSCSTTFEMGIDLGDLQAVAMSNIPPSVANYRQRAGRAGRKSSGTAFILTWASDRPHDQAYYNAPTEIVSGQVKIPNIRLENELILRRHVNALLFSEFLRFLKHRGIETKNLTNCGDFFEDQLEDQSKNVAHLQKLSAWKSENMETLNDLLEQYSKKFSNSSSSIRSCIKKGIDNFVKELENLNRDHYQPLAQHYKIQIEDLSKKISNPNLAEKDREELYSKREFFYNLRDRLRGGPNRSGALIEYLSDKGVLPSYSFPLHTVELVLPKLVLPKNEEKLRLERDLRQAIIEYAPGREIVADKRIWKSSRPLFHQATPRIQEYRICEKCHNLEISRDAGVEIDKNIMSCAICHNEFSNQPIRKFVIPDGFLADKDSGKPAKQYVTLEQNQMRSALIPKHELHEEKLNDFVSTGYNPKGKLLYVNEGKYGSGFKFRPIGFDFNSTPNNGAEEKYSLGFIQETNTLHINFTSGAYFEFPKPSDQSFWLSLLYSIIQGACKSLQIERRDIDGVLFPRSTSNSWEQTIVLYDNVPGGAGHVKEIKENLLTVLKEAMRVLNCPDCAPDTSCYHCLRDYNNQYHHHLLKRETASKILEKIVSSTDPINSELVNVNRVSASNPAMWLHEKITYAKQSVRIMMTQLDSRHPKGENHSWLDTIAELVKKNCEVTLYLQKIPNEAPEDFILLDYLRVLHSKGLTIKKINESPKWQAIIDEKDNDYARIIGSENINDPILFSDQIGCKSLLTCTEPESIQKIIAELKYLRTTSISEKNLEAPPNTKVIDIKATSSKGHSEYDYFVDFFRNPVKSLIINDPYLFDRERIVCRLGEYIALANQPDNQISVTVFTSLADRIGHNFEEQNNAIKELKEKFSKLDIKFCFEPSHDRFIEVNRINGERARIIIGRGIDFIKPDGSLKKTFIVIQDPIE